MVILTKTQNCSQWEQVIVLPQSTVSWRLTLWATDDWNEEILDKIDVSRSVGPKEPLGIVSETLTIIFQEQDNLGKVTADCRKANSAPIFKKEAWRIADKCYINPLGILEQMFEDYM